MADTTDSGLAPDMEATLRRQAALAEAMGFAPGQTLSLADQRRLVNETAEIWAVDEAGEAPIVEDVLPFSLPGATGVRRAVLYRPNVPAPAGIVLYLHGGGWVKGSPEAVEWPCRQIAARSGLNVLAASYSLAPEAPFPAARDDAAAMLDWCMGASARAGLDHRRVLVAGASAGAHVALSAVLARRYAGQSLPLGLALFYGAYGGSLDTPSYEAFADGRYGLGRADMRGYIDAYMNGADGFDLLNADLARLPPVWLGAAGKDVLRDDSMMLHQALTQAGVDSRLRIDEGLAHSYSPRAGHVRAARDAVNEAADFLAREARRVSALKAGPA